MPDISQVRGIYHLAYGLEIMVSRYDEQWGGTRSGNRHRVMADQRILYIGEAGDAHDNQGNCVLVYDGLNPGLDRLVIRDKHKAIGR